MSWRRSDFALVALALSSWCAPSCRGLTLCAESCGRTPGAAGTPTDDDQPPVAGGDGGAPSAPERAAGGESGTPEAGATSGGAPAEEPVDAPPCALPSAECDGTLQTRCESDLTWNARHCGDCEHACDGACLQGNCTLEEPVLEAASAVAVLALRDYFYITTSEAQLVRADRATGETKLWAAEVSNANALAWSGDFLYLWDHGWTNLVQRMPLAGGAVEREDFETDEFGASAAGIYYVLDGALWFRPNGSSQASTIHTSYIDILCSSPSFVLVRGGLDDPMLYRTDGAQLITLGPGPKDVHQAVCDGDFALLMSGPAWNRQVTRITLQGVEASQPIPQSSYVLEKSALVFDGERFSLTFEDHGHVNVRTFRLGGKDYEEIVGLPNDSLLVHRNAGFVWYNTTDPPRLSSHLKRARLSMPDP